MIIIVIADGAQEVPGITQINLICILLSTQELCEIGTLLPSQRHERNSICIHITGE